MANESQKLDHDLGELEATAEMLEGMVQAKTRENTELLNEVARLQQELVNFKSRTLKVHEENTLLKAAPQVASEIALMEYQLRLATKFVEGKAFPQELTAEQAFTIMRAGEEMGLKPIEALNGLYVVNGKIQPWGKLLTSQITRAGYHITFPEETKEKCVAVAEHPATGHRVTGTAYLQDPIIQRSRAHKIAPQQKMRFHALRLIANFHLAHLFGGTSDLFAEVQDIEYEEVSPRNHKAVGESEERARMLRIIDKATTVKELERVKAHKVTHDLVEEYDAKLQSLITAQEGK